MQLVYLSPFCMVLVDVFAWFCFHMGISIAMLKLPDHFFDSHKIWFRTWKWEQKGTVWQKTFRVQSWKHHLPDGSIFLKKAYNKSSMGDAHLPTLNKFLLEMRRAEMTHWLSMIPAIFFFLWNPPWVGWIMVMYAVLMNTPFIIVQRYNRPRVENIYKRKQERQQRYKK